MNMITEHMSEWIHFMFLYMFYEYRSEKVSGADRGWKSIPLTRFLLRFYEPTTETNLCTKGIKKDTNDNGAEKQAHWNYNKNNKNNSAKTKE